MDKPTQKAQAINSGPKRTKAFQCPFCKKGRMLLKVDIFVCNRKQCPKKQISKEEGIKYLMETLEKIQEDDRFGIKKRK